MSPRRPRVQCLDRALTILEALARRESMGVTELATEVGLNVSTVHNILGVLLARGYLLNEGGRYRCGPALLALARQGDPLSSIPSVAQPCLEEITRRTGESAVVGVLSGDGLTMLAATASADGLSCPAAGQVFRPAMTLATGRLLIACGAGRDWDVHIAAYLDRLSATGRAGEATAEALRDELTRIRESGVCVVRLGNDSGSVAMAVRDARGVIVAALGANSIGRLADEVHWDRLVGEVGEAARRVSAGLGYASAAPAAERRAS